jgi:hypothetical protein
MRPGGGIVVAVAPSRERIATEAVDEDDIRLAQGIITTGDLMQSAQSSKSSYTCSAPVNERRVISIREAT